MSSNSPTFDPSNPWLSGVFGKMNRAVDHVKELDTWFQSWRDSDAWSTHTETDSEGVAKRIYFQITNPVPIWVALVVGDAIHNLRSALDHLAAAQAIKSGKTEKGVWFPIAQSADVFPSTRDDKLRKCPEAFRDFVSEFEPYKGGNDTLFTLHQMDIIDKHQLLLPVGAASEITVDADAGLYGAIDFSKTAAPVKIKSIGKGGLVKDGDTIINFGPAFWFPEKTQIRTEAALSVVFGKDTPMPWREVRGTLREMVVAVERIVLDAEPRFFR